MIAIKYNPIFRAHPINIGEYWLQPVREDFPFVSYYVAHRYHREYGFLSPVGSLACVSCLKFNLHSVDSSHSCSFKHKLLIFLRTRIIQMTRMSPVGSLACVSCLKFNLHSVDSSHSCSFKHKLLIFLRTRIIQMTRMSPVGSLACVSCLKFNLHSVDSSHSCSFKTKVLRVSSPSNKDQRS